MSIDVRATELYSLVTAFSEESYTKADFLPELLKLQQELVTLTFNGEHAENGNLQIWDVEKHLQKMNDTRGNPADAELKRFIQSSKEICNTIRAEISGHKGEEKVFRLLGNLACPNVVLHNVELEFDGRRTEIDAIVFTNQAVFIIEIKNSRKDILIDENGNFFRVGNAMSRDCNIAEKMDVREEMLRMALSTSGVCFPRIFKIVVFTNHLIKLDSRYRYLKVLYSNYLQSFIENFVSDRMYTDEDINAMVAAVSEAKCQEAYRMSVDMDTYKKDFATIMALLESAEDAQCADLDTVEDKPEPSVSLCTEDGMFEHRMQLRIAFGKGAAAAIGITLAGAVLFGIGKMFRK